MVEIIWFVMTAVISTVIGIIVEKTFGISAKVIKRFTKRQKEKKIRFTEFDSVITLARGDAYFEEGQLEIARNSKRFYLGFPEHIKSKILEIDKKFEFRIETLPEDDIFIKTENSLRISGLSDLINETKIEVANDFLNVKLRGRELFNGELIGIDKFYFNRDGRSEETEVRISAYTTDYFTHRVMNNVAKKLKKEFTDFFVLSNKTDLNDYSIFMTAIGVNSTIKLNDSNSYPLAKRSGDLDNMERAQWHVPMNEAVSLNDIGSNNQISVEECVRRGLYEELNIKKSELISTIRVGDIFFVRDKFEIGITAFTELNMSESEFLQMTSHAKDGSLENRGFKFIKRRNIVENMMKEDMTSAGIYTFTALFDRIR